MKKNDIIELEIIDITHEGSGVGRYEGMAIFVPIGSDADHTRNCEWYDGIYGYLKEVGICELQ